MKVTAAFAVAPASDTGSGIIKGDGPGSADIPATTNSASAGQLTLPATEATNAFPETVDFLDPMLLTWSCSFDGGATFCNAGTSTNQVYITWAKPKQAAPIHTLVHVGCTAAQGEMGVLGTNDNRVRDKVWTKIQTQAIRRASDNFILTYYGFYDVNSHGVWDVGVDIDRNSPATCMVTTAAGLISTGNGQCGAWDRFFDEVLTAQGLDHINGNSNMRKNHVTMKVILLALICTAATSTFPPEAEELADADKHAQLACSNLLRTTEYAEMLSLVASWKTNLTSLGRQSLFGVLLVKMGSKSKVELQGGPVLKQDVSTEGGRCAWALEQLLGSELPVITERSTERDIAKSAYVAECRFRESVLSPEKRTDVSNLTIEQRLKLAQSEQTDYLVLAKLAMDAEPSIRLAVAVNKKSPGRTLAFLLRNDPDDSVRKAAWENSQHTRLSAWPD